MCSLECSLHAGAVGSVCLHCGSRVLLDELSRRFGSATERYAENCQVNVVDAYCKLCNLTLSILAETDEVWTHCK